MAPETVTISKKEYERLKANENFLKALIVCGVDNWEGYADAQELMEDEEDD